MSFKSWSAGLKAPRKDTPDDKSKMAPAVDQPPVQPDKTPSAGKPAAKS